MIKVLRDDKVEEVLSRLPNEDYEVARFMFEMQAASQKDVIYGTKLVTSTSHKFSISEEKVKNVLVQIVNLGAFQERYHTRQRLGNGGNTQAYLLNKRYFTLEKSKRDKGNGKNNK